VLEDVGGLGQEPLLVDDFERLQLPQEPLQLPGEASDPLQQAAHELAADHRRELHRPLAVLAETIETGHDDPVDGVGDGYLGALHHPVVAVLEPEQAQVEQCLRHLLDEERHALGLVHQGGTQSGREAIAAEHPARHHERIGLRQRVEGQRRDEAARADRWGVTEPVRQHQEHPRARHRVHEVR
jgi:hypothetical protein